MRYLGLLIGVTLLISIGCDKHSKNSKQSEVVFSYQKVSQSEDGDAGDDGGDEDSSGTGPGALETEAASVVVTVEDAEGFVYYVNHAIELYGELGKQISKPLGLTPGTYQLTGFIVLDNDGEPLYVTPRSGSEYAYLVSSPLPLTFEVRPDSIEKLVPEVIKTDGPLSSYGYTTESFEFVETIDFYVSVFVENDGDMQFIPANLTVTNASDPAETLYDDQLEDRTEFIRVRETGADYELTFTADGFKSSSMTLSAADLAQYAATPLVVVLNPETGIVIFEFPLEVGNEAAIEKEIGATVNNFRGKSFAMSKTSALDDPDSRKVMVVTIRRISDGQIMLNRRHIELQITVSDDDQEVWRAELELEDGEYEITELFLMSIDSSANRPIVVTEAVPVVGSPLEGESATPLPISVAVQTGEVSTLAPNTVAIENHAAGAFGYDSYPDVMTYSTRIQPYYQGTSASAYCLSRVAIEVAACEETPCNDDDYVDLCELYNAYRGTTVFESMCPKWTRSLKTPHRTSDVHPLRCDNLPLIAVPDGFAKYRVRTLKRRHAEGIGEFDRTDVSGWDFRRTESIRMDAVDAPAFGVSYRNQDGEAQLLVDAEGFMGEPDTDGFDSDAGAYPVVTLPDSVDFGVVEYDEIVTKTFTVTNTGNADLELSNIRIDNNLEPDNPNPAFVLESVSTQTVSPGEQTELTITFQYNEGDDMVIERTATLVIPHNDAHVQAVDGKPAFEVGLSVTVESICEQDMCSDGDNCTIDICKPDEGCVYENDTELCECIDDCGCYPKNHGTSLLKVTSTGQYQWDMSHCDYLEVEGFIVAGGGDGGDGGRGYLCESGGGGGGGGAGEVKRFERQAFTPGVYVFDIGKRGKKSTLSGPDFNNLKARPGEDGEEADGPDKGNDGDGYPHGENGDDGNIGCFQVAGGSGGDGGNNHTSYGHGGDGGEGSNSGATNEKDGDKGESGGAEVKYFCFVCPSTVNN